MNNKLYGKNIRDISAFAARLFAQVTRLSPFPMISKCASRSRWLREVQRLAILGATLLAANTAAATSPFDAAFTQLLNTINTAPDAQIRAPGYRTYLRNKAKHAQADADQAMICRAEATLARERRSLLKTSSAGAAGHKGPKVAAVLASAIEADILNVESLLLSQPGAVDCGGASTPPSNVGTPVVTVTSADNTQVTFHISFPPPRFTANSGGGRTFMQVSMPGMGNISSEFPAGELANGTEVGLPELPGISKLFAVPKGELPAVQVLDVSSFKLPAVQIWPVQPPTAAAATTGPLPSLGLASPPPFTINNAFYVSSVAYPSSDAVGGPVYSMHGLPIGSVALAGAHYVPSSGELTVVTGMDVRVSFSGNSSNVFGTTRLFDPYNGAFIGIWKNNLINWGSVGQSVSPVPPPRPCGEEMMVITSPELQSAADSFAADRSAHGIITKVFVSGDSANDDAGHIGDTPEDILAYIAQTYNDTPLFNDAYFPCTRPSYVLLMGDTTQVPTFEISLGRHYDSKKGKTVSNFWEDPVATDMPYGFVHQQAQVVRDIQSVADGTFHNYITDYDQDLFVGRIPAANLDQANIIAGMIERYEDSAPAPTNSNFYKNVVGAEFFQACPDPEASCRDAKGNSLALTHDRTSFLRSSEFVGTEAKVAGKNFVRVAQDEQIYGPAVPITPLTFDDGTPIPPSINFNGTAVDIKNAVNSGAFLLWHSDHGYVSGSGWAEPLFYVDQLSLLNEPGEELPVIWSSDCDTGKFDAEFLLKDPSFYQFPFVSKPATNFGEQTLRLHKAIAFVGASRESPITGDGYMLEGMSTNLFPEKDNAWRKSISQPIESPVLELGPLLDAAKIFMAEQTSADLTKNFYAQGTLLEYNDLGDPSMPIWRDDPKIYQEPSFTSLLESGHVVVGSTQAGMDGTLVTLVDNDGITLGVGVLENGTATIPVSSDLSSLQGITAILSNDRFLSASVALSSPPIGIY